MKLLASLIMTIALACGLIAALTAYVPALDAISPDDGLTLNAPAGVDPDHDEDDPFPPGPRVNPATADEPIVLTAELIEQLKEDGETRVRVKEFDFGRWEYWWLFVVAAVGLFVGAMMMRVALRRALEESQPTDEAGAVSPPDLLMSALDRLMQLRNEVQSAPDRHAAMKRIITTIDSIHAEQLDPFVNAKQTLIARYGMAGYAQLMDAFAASERQINRTWSASADEVYEEAVETLDEAIVRMERAIDQLNELSGEIDRDRPGGPTAPREQVQEQEPPQRPGEPPNGHDHDRPLS